MRKFSPPKKLMRRGELTSTYYSRVYDTDTQKDTWRSTGCRSKRAAEEWVRTRELEEAMGVDRARMAEGRAKTFADAFAEWIESKRGKVTQDHLYDLEKKGAAYWVPFFGGRKLSEITPEVVDEFLRKRSLGQVRRDEIKRAPKVNASTVNGDRRRLSNLFKYAMRRGWIVTNPVALTDKWPSESKRRVFDLTPEEESAFLRACREPEILEMARGDQEFEQSSPPPTYLEVACLIALHYGFRTRTILSLQWRHVDFERSRWRIPGDLVKTRVPITMRITDIVLTKVCEYRAGIEERCVARGENVAERLGPDRSIFGLRPTSRISRSVARAARRAGLPHFTTHDMRRIALNRLRSIGVELDIARSITGHSLATALKYYRQVSTESIDEALALSEKRFRQFGS